MLKYVLKIMDIKTGILIQTGEADAVVKAEEGMCGTCEYMYE